MISYKIENWNAELPQGLKLRLQTQKCLLKKIKVVYTFTNKRKYKLFIDNINVLNYSCNILITFLSECSNINKYVLIGKT